MSLINSDAIFLVSVSPEEIRREKEKAKDLRKSQWWQRQVSRGSCHYCRSQTLPEELTMDHIVPLIRGGRSTRGNVVPACKACNNRKKYLLPMEWEDYLRDWPNRQNSGTTQHKSPPPKDDPHGRV